MDWIEVTAKTVADAKELALDRLGVVEDELEFEIVDEPKGGLFGLGRADARIRARVKPLSRDKPVDRRRRRGRSERSERSSSSGSRAPRSESSRSETSAKTTSSGGSRSRGRRGGRNRSGGGAKSETKATAEKSVAA